MGVFVICLMFCFNFIGMLFVEFKGICCQKDQVILEFGSFDFVDGMLVVDIKLYFFFVEVLLDVSVSYVQQVLLVGMNVSFMLEIDVQLFMLEKCYLYIKVFICEVLVQDLCLVY